MADLTADPLGAPPAHGERFHVGAGARTGSAGDPPAIAAGRSAPVAFDTGHDRSARESEAGRTAPVIGPPRAAAP